MALIALVTSALSASVFFSNDVVYRARSHARMGLIFKSLPTVLGFPLFSNAALIIWSLVNDIVSLELLHRLFNDSRDLRIIATHSISAALWLGLAVMSSGRMCSIFEAQRALAAERELLSAMITMMCDATIWLSEDCHTILGSDCRFKMILGRDVTGEDVCDSLAEDERQRLHERVAFAKAAPQLLPSTLVTQNGCQIPVEMFIVGNRETEARGRGNIVPAFLIGIKVGEHHVYTPGPAVGLESASMEPVRLQPEEMGPEDCQSTLDHRSIAQESAPETTVTGHLFDRIWEMPGDQPCEMQHRLKEVLELGEKERWLLAPADLKIAAGKTLGAGSYGVVVAGWLHGSPVAVKATKQSEDSVGAKHVVAIANEIRILRHVRHPNVVLFHGACVEPDEGELVLVLERVQGPSLCQYVEMHPSDSEVGKRFQLLLDVVCALRYLHALKPQVVHGDLKGSNILVEPAIPRAKLLDFGISRILTREARPSGASAAARLGGSLQWMAPEIICRVADKPHPSADVFSLGRIACMIATCKTPLAGLHRRAIVSMAYRGVTHINFWEQDRPLHDECRVLCNRLLSHAPADRPTASQAHQEISTWAPLLAGEEIPALELSRAVDTDDAGPAGMHPALHTLSSFRRAWRSANSERDTARKRSHDSRAGPDTVAALQVASVLESVREQEGARSAGDSPESCLANRCSL